MQLVLIAQDRCVFCQLYCFFFEESCPHTGWCNRQLLDPELEDENDLMFRIQRNHACPGCGMPCIGCEENCAARRDECECAPSSCGQSCSCVCT